MKQADKQRRLGVALLDRTARMLCGAFFVAQVLLPPLHGLQAALSNADRVPCRSELGPGEVASPAEVGAEHPGAEGGHQEASCTVCKIFRQASFPPAPGATWRAEVLAPESVAGLERSVLALVAFGRPSSRAPPARA